MNKSRLDFLQIFQLDIYRAVQILIWCAFLISALAKLGIQDATYGQKAISLIVNSLIAILLIKNLQNKIHDKSILFLLFSPSFFIIYGIYNNYINILWDLFFLSFIILFSKDKIIKDERFKYLLSLLIFSICLIIDFRIIFLLPLILYCIFYLYFTNTSSKQFLISSLLIYVGAFTYYRNSFFAPHLSSVDYFFVAINSLIAIAPLFLFGYARRNWMVGVLSALGLAPMVLMGLPLYFSIYCFVSVLTFASLFNVPREAIFSMKNPSSLGIILLGATLWALPLKDSTHFRAGIFVEILNKLSATPKKDPLEHPFWQRVGKQYSSAVIGEFDVVQKAANREDFIFYFKRASNIQSVEYKNERNWRPLGMAQPNGKTIYILDEWASNPDLVIFFDPRRDMLATIDGYSVFVPGWISCKDGCPEVFKGLPLDWYVFKSWPEVEGGLLIKRIPPRFNSEEMLYFNSSGKGLPTLLGGWSSPENWGVWTKDKEANLLLPSPEHGEKYLILNVRALITDAHPVQIVSVFLNGVFQRKFSLTKGEGNLIDIDLSLLPPSKNRFTVELKIDNPMSPKELGLSEDFRKLGIGLVSAELK